jgi:uncharacterized phage protein gp47/JayE
MTQITDQGFVRTSLQERLDSLRTAIKAIFGDSINLDPDTIDGQTIGIFADSISNLDKLAEDIYHSFNPSSATGTALSRLVQLNGIRRIGGTYSTCDVVCIGQAGTVIPAGSLIQSTATQAIFKTDFELTIGDSGTGTVSCKAVDLGEQQAPANTLTDINTPIYGWQSVNNPTAAVVGRDEETDAELRIRRAKSTATAAQSVLEGIYGSIANLPGVTQVQVYENSLDTRQASTQLPPHSIQCVVQGGDLADIANAIWLKKTAGVTLTGNTQYIVKDSMGNEQNIVFSRPVSVPVYMIVNLSKKVGWPSDGVGRIQNALVQWVVDNQQIGEELIQSRLYEALNSIPGHSVTSLLIGTAANPTSTNNISVPFNGLAIADTSKIVVNVS